jgi:hypothetical protein
MRTRIPILWITPHHRSPDRLRFRVGDAARTGGRRFVRTSTNQTAASRRGLLPVVIRTHSVDKGPVTPLS